MMYSSAKSHVLAVFAVVSASLIPAAGSTPRALLQSDRVTHTVGITFAQSFADNSGKISQKDGLKKLRDAGLVKLKLFQYDEDVLKDISEVYEEDISAGNLQVTIQSPLGLWDTSKSTIEEVKDELTYLKPYAGFIKYVAIGNEPLLDEARRTDGTLDEGDLYSEAAGAASDLATPLETTQAALAQLGFSAHAIINFASSMLENTYPPSAAVVSPKYTERMRGVLSVYKKHNTPFFVNMYPIFAYQSNPTDIPLSYAACDSSSQAAAVAVDGVEYDCLFDAMYDGTVAALGKLGFQGEVKVSETGWPTAGHAAATKTMAALYVTEIMRRAPSGTPKHPGKPVDVYLFSAFDEKGKVGGDMERNFGVWTQEGRFKYATRLDDGVLESSTSMAPRPLCARLLASLAALLTTHTMLTLTMG